MWVTELNQMGSWDNGPILNTVTVFKWKLVSFSGVLCTHLGRCYSCQVSNHLSHGLVSDETGILIGDC